MPAYRNPRKRLCGRVTPYTPRKRVYARPPLYYAQVKKCTALFVILRWFDDTRVIIERASDFYNEEYKGVLRWDKGYDWKKCWREIGYGENVKDIKWDHPTWTKWKADTFELVLEDHVFLTILRDASGSFHLHSHDYGWEIRWANEGQCME